MSSSHTDNRFITVQTDRTESAVGDRRWVTRDGDVVWEIEYGRWRWSMGDGVWEMEYERWVTRESELTLKSY